MSSHWLVRLAWPTAVLLVAALLAACNSSSTTETTLSAELASIQGTWVSGCKTDGTDSWLDSVFVSGSTLTSQSLDYTGTTDCTGDPHVGTPESVPVAIGATVTPSNDANPAKELDMGSGLGMMKSIIQIDTTSTTKTFRVGDDLGPMDGNGRFTALETRQFTNMTGAMLSLQGLWQGACRNEVGAPGSWYNMMRFTGTDLGVHTVQFAANDCPAGTGALIAFSAGDQVSFSLGAQVTPGNDTAPANAVDFATTGGGSEKSIIQIKTSTSPNTLRIGDNGGPIDGTGRFTDLEARVFSKITGLLLSLQGDWVGSCKVVNVTDSIIDRVTIVGDMMFDTPTNYAGSTTCSGSSITDLPMMWTMVLGGTVTPANDPGPANAIDLIDGSGTGQWIIKVDTTASPYTFRFADDQVAPVGGRYTSLETRVFTRQ